MQETKIYRRSQYQKMPWKNGLGETLEMKIFPEGASLGKGDFSWRISSAKVMSDGPFSLFSGYHRWLTILKGPGLILNKHLLGTNETFQFSGDEAIHAKRANSGEELEDLGVIYKSVNCVLENREGQGELILEVRPFVRTFLVSLSTKLALAEISLEYLDMVEFAPKDQPSSVAITLPRSGGRYVVISIW